MVTVFVTSHYYNQKKKIKFQKFINLCENYILLYKKHEKGISEIDLIQLSFSLYFIIMIWKTYISFSVLLVISIVKVQAQQEGGISKCIKIFGIQRKKKFNFKLYYRSY